VPAYLPPRRGISHSAAIAQSRVYATVDEPELLTLAFYHSAFVDDFGQPTAVYVVCDNDPLQATIEADAPLNAGEEVTFKPVAVRVVMPAESEDSRDPRAQIEIDHVTRLLSPYLREAAASMEPVRLIARSYLPSDTSAPHEMPPLRLELTGANGDNTTIRISAGYGDILNFPFPAVRYTPEDFAGLAAAA
jgi:hypothetical protein